MKLSPNAPCPCHSGAKFKKCCRPLHRGAPAESPVALMRSRYAAYALGDVSYLQLTTDPEGAHYRPDTAAWEIELRHYCARTAFEGLEVREHGEDGDTGWVLFHARLRQGDDDLSFSERSSFRRHDGRWLYHDGAQIDPRTP
ncbi:MAG: SEC-C domain-containing protein [Planctomycetes bacterium]|nr:SEC-C domain-containing protein [Planctomycetota bacterium]